MSANQKWAVKQLKQCFGCRSNDGREHTINIVWNNISYDNDVYCLCYWCYKTLINNYKAENKTNVIKLIGEVTVIKVGDNYKTIDNDIVLILLSNKKRIVDKKDKFYSPNDIFFINRKKIIQDQISINQNYEKLNMAKIALNDKTLMFKYLPFDITNIIINIMKSVIGQ